MDDGYIALLDSGVGGLSLLKEFITLMPNEKYLYFGDNGNAPYGNKNLRTLREITFRNIDFIKSYKVKILAVACNTLSVSLLEEIAEYSGIKTFGVFPPVEIAVIEKKPTLLLATERTAENFRNVNGLHSVGLKNLAKDIEANSFNLSAVSLNENLKNTSDFYMHKRGYYHTVILGCTHYFFVKDKIFNHFRPRKILYGEKFTAKNVFNYLKNAKLLVKHKRKSILFIGDYAKINSLFFNLNGQKFKK